jgi:hypothetical protein
MIQERRDLEEQLNCSFVSLRACIVGIYVIKIHESCDTIMFLYCFHSFLSSCLINIYRF